MTELNQNPEHVVSYLLSKHSLTQVELANRVNRSQAFISDLVNKRRQLSPQLVEELETNFPDEPQELWRQVHNLCAKREGWKI